MKILLTGASGYIGKRILPVLLDEGHEVMQQLGIERDFIMIIQIANCFI